MVSADPKRGALPYLGLSEAQLLAQCEVDTFRGSGPGGQKRNKTDSAVRIRHRPTGLSGSCSESRSQHDNRRRALRRLRRELASKLRAEVDLETWRPSTELAKLVAPRGETVGQRHPAYLPAIAALLDLFVAHDCALRPTAESLGLSSAALSKRLLADEALGQRVNELRRERGLRPLR